MAGDGRERPYSAATRVSKAVMMLSASSNLPFWGEPARALRQGPADPPDEDGAMGADQDDPTPTIDAERRPWHEQIREKGGDRYGRETDGLATSEGPATNMLGH